MILFAGVLCYFVCSCLLDDSKLRLFYLDIPILLRLSRMEVSSSYVFATSVCLLDNNSSDSAFIATSSTTAQYLVDLNACCNDWCNHEELWDPACQSSRPPV